MKKNQKKIIIMMSMILGLTCNFIDAVTFENNTDVTVDVIILSDKITIAPHQTSTVTPTFNQITIQVSAAGFKTYRSKTIDKKTLPQRYIITIDEHENIKLKGLNKKSANTITFENNTDVTINIQGPLGSKNIAAQATTTITPTEEVATYTISSTGFTPYTTKPITKDSLPRSFIISIDQHKKINCEQI